MKPSLNEQSIELRHLKLSDAKAYYECQNNPEAQKAFICIPKGFSGSVKEMKMKMSNYNPKKPSGECFAIILEGEFAGYVELCHMNEKSREHIGEIGYCIHPKHRNKGIATAAVKLATDYAFKKYKLKRMVGVCRIFNKASARVLEKAGYKLEGIHKKEAFKDGKYYDNMHWARTR